MIEAIQALPPIPTHEPLKDEATRAWLQKHGFDLTRWLAWSDIANEAGTLCRHFRQDEKPLAAMPGQKVMLATPDPFYPEAILAHTIEEGGIWLRGYAPNWSTAVHRDGRVFDRVCERSIGKLLRGTFSTEQLLHIDAVINGRVNYDIHLGIDEGYGEI